MKSLYPVKGIITVLNTPFKPDGSLDLLSLRKNIQEAINAGVHGFLIPAMASEVCKLSQKERIALVETTLHITNGRIPVFAGMGEKNLTQSRRLLKSYKALGCREFLFNIHFRNEDQFKYHFLKLAELEPEEIMLQDWDISGYGLPGHLILELFNEVENFRCLKVEVVPAGLKYSQILKLTRGKLHISGGWAINHMLEGLQRGVHAFMPTGMHYIYTQIYNYYVSGNLPDAEKLFSEVIPVLVFSNQHLDISIHFFKRLLYEQRIYSTPLVRQPSLPFDEIYEEITRKLIKKVISIEDEIKKQRLEQ